MKVSTLQPFQIVYSLFEHEYLGFLFEAYVVQLNSKGDLTLQNQSVSSKNIQEFSERLDTTDFELVKLTEATQQEIVAKKFSTKKQHPLDFFLKVFDPEKGDKLLQETIHGYMEKHRSDILERLLSKKSYIMSNDGDPTWKAINNIQEGAKAYFNFVRNDENTQYFPTIKCGGERVQFQFKNARILCESPAWLLIDDKLYHFDKQVDGKKLKPFLNKKNIIIPRNIEDTYYQKFIAPLVAQFDVFAQGFDIKFERHDSKPVLIISETITQKKIATSIVDPNEKEEDEENDDENKIVFDLSFQYGSYNFKFDSFSAEAYVSVEKQNSQWVFHKVKRDLRYEKAQVNLLKELGLDVRQGRSSVIKRHAFSWLQCHAQTLEKNNFEVKQLESNQNQKQYFLGYSEIKVKIEEKNDWFDIQAKVHFGEFEIPFLKLRSLILGNKREFTLPNGQIAVIPEEWFTRYSELFSYVNKLDDDVTILKKHHLVLVQDLTDEGLAHSVMTRKLERLRNFDKIQQYETPKGLLANLRPYQKAGYDWLRFLAEYKLGGCLADDMGLGKTIQTLAFLQSQKELDLAENPTLLVMPTSLIYNWMKEIEKFTPNLKALVYTGSNREKNTEQFDEYDLILTSYGILRLDIDFIKDYRFNYVILDESQSIKNPTSNISKAVMQLNAANRLILTGTPLENSTMDLWTQLTFINPGLLGTQNFFKNEYQIPIEKHQDEQKTKRLYSVIKPFMMRRHKSQVATELPPKVESIHYCDMTEEQEKCYEEAKSYYRNIILEQIEEKGFGKSQMAVLQGLTKLRQLANHPLMIDETYEGDSGKNEEVIQKLETIVEEGHKVLIFSQFVKHLNIFRQYLDKNKIDYCYLDGSTNNRQVEVDRFQNDNFVKIFLISLKAGGLGLNLTAAEYVFLLDPWWNPAIEAQAIDRAHRIGQQNTVFTYKFITRNSVEEKILALQRNKRKLFDNLITTEENFVKSLSKDDILSLLE